MQVKFTEQDGGKLWSDGFNLYTVDWTKDSITSACTGAGFANQPTLLTLITDPEQRWITILTHPLFPFACAVLINGEEREELRAWWTNSDGAQPPAPFDQPFSIVL